jgi:hypothetical protein
MISIGKPYVFRKDGSAFLKAPVRVSEDTATRYMDLEKKLRKVHWRLKENYPPAQWEEKDAGLWFSVPEEYAEGLCCEQADAFVVAMLWYAMQTGSDIRCEAPISEQLAFSIRNFLIPALCKEEKGYRRIRLDCTTTDVPYPTKDKVGTGMSCGVDSLYTLKMYSEDVPEKFRLTHLAYFNMGAIFHPDDTRKTYSLEEFYRKTDKMSDEKCENAYQVASRAGLPLIYVQSNLDKDYYRGAYGYTAVYRNCACVLALQGLFGKYYCSSAGWPDYYDPSLSEGSEHYESLLCTALSTESLRFILSDYATRIEKTKALADWDIAQDYLDVCFHFNNCGKCAKCYRTLVTLDILGKVDSFGKVFRVREYRENRKKAYGWLLNTRLGDEKDDNAVFARDIYHLAKEKNIRFSLSSYAWMIVFFAKGILVKIYHLIK